MARQTRKLSGSVMCHVASLPDACVVRPSENQRGSQRLGAVETKIKKIESCWKQSKGRWWQRRENGIDVFWAPRLLSSERAGMNRRRVLFTFIQQVRLRRHGHSSCPLSSALSIVFLRLPWERLRCLPEVRRAGSSLLFLLCLFISTASTYIPLSSSIFSLTESPFI